MMRFIAVCYIDIYLANSAFPELKNHRFAG